MAEPHFGRYSAWGIAILQRGCNVLGLQKEPQQSMQVELRSFETRITSSRVEIRREQPGARLPNLYS
jgi:hypothetical protein